ncbi:type II toxin-antitoxin system RelB/DinJ family antitoxin [Lacticaseibacillus suibinensis]|uniref:type II toxin-antitoxin system RelB/DinJ family antitoxin n=1 Tax=Lacticaseibacillus suibinensis TaxID=2486011 RepID=UPI0019421FC3|nr:type II toxin-antitoxin system RelB/DinJ family antitoxin [Lacticaseibacillus suibinensis]
MRLDNQTVRVFARVDPETKKAAEEALAAMGFSVSAALTVFLRQVARDKRFPFTPDARDLAEIEKQKKPKMK